MQKWVHPQDQHRLHTTVHTTCNSSYLDAAHLFCSWATDLPTTELVFTCCIIHSMDSQDLKKNIKEINLYSTLSVCQKFKQTKIRPINLKPVNTMNTGRIESKEPKWTIHNPKKWTPSLTKPWLVQAMKPPHLRVFGQIPRYTWTSRTRLGAL